MNIFRTKYSRLSFLTACLVIMVLFTLLQRSDVLEKQASEMALKESVNSTRTLIELFIKRNIDLFEFLAREEAANVDTQKELPQSIREHVAKRPELANIVYVNSSLTSSIAAIESPSPLFMNTLTTDNEHHQIASEALKNKAAALSQKKEVVAGVKGFEIWVPVFTNGEIRGYLVALLSFDSLLNLSVTPTSRAAFSFHMHYGPDDQSEHINLAKMAFSHEIKSEVDSFSPKVYVVGRLDYANIFSKSSLFLTLLGLSFATCLVVLLYHLNKSLVLQHEAEFQLKEQQDQIKRAEELSFIMTTFVSLDGYITKSPPLLEQILGYSSEELRKLSIFDLTHPEDRDNDKSQFLRLVKGEIKQYDFEKRDIRKDGKIVWLYICRSLVTDSKGTPLYILSYIKDITEQKTTEEELSHIRSQVQQSQKLESLGILAGGVAHDFNNLLVGIMGNADLGLVKTELSHPARPYFASILEASQKAADLCRQMLAYSGKGRFVIQKTDLSATIAEMKSFLETSASHGIVLTFNLDSNLAPISVDRNQLKQVILNLVSNSAEAIQHSFGTIAISTGQMYCSDAFLGSTYLPLNLKAGNYVFLEVSDNGAGMDDEMLTKIFDPFFSTKFTGRGLGLAAVHGIIRGHGGAIKVSSAIGQGTAFRVYFPSEEANEREISSLEGKAQKGLHGTVLVVDDEQVVLHFVSEVLEVLGISVIASKDGLSAIEALKNNKDRVQLVLLDMTMPGIGGREVYDQIRQISPQVNVVLSSGYSEETATDSFPPGALAGFLQKPYRVNELRALVRKLLESSEGQ